MDRLLKRLQRVRLAAFCSREFFLLHDNAPAHKAANVCQFLTQKMLKHFITPSPPYSPDLFSARLFSVPQFENEVKKGLHFADFAEIQEAVTDELKKVQKEELSAAFQKVYDYAKVYIHV